MRTIALGHARTAQARPQAAPSDGQAHVTTQAPLRLWGDVLSRLRVLLHGQALSEDQFHELAWHVRTSRYSSGQVIALRGQRAGLWALVVSGAVAARPGSGSTKELLSTSSRKPTEMLSPGDVLGEEMLLCGDPSPCTYRAVGEVELFVLRRSDFLSVTSSDQGGVASRTPERGRVSVMLLVLALVVLTVAGTWLSWGGLQGAVRRVGPRDLPAPPSVQIRVSDPIAGSAVMSQSSIQIESVVTGNGLDRVVLLVDNIAMATHDLTGSLGSGPQEVRLAWTGAELGTHTLVLRVDGANGTTASSAQVTVTVVPAGRLVFSSNRNGADAVYEMTTDGSAVRLLTAGPGACRQPAIGLAGSLVFVAEEEGALARLRYKAGEVASVVDLFTGRDPAWSWDGQSLVFARSVSGATQVFVARTADWSARQLTAESIYAGQPTCSPDGAWVAYVAERGGNLDIWAADSARGESVSFASSPMMEWAPAWSPDGSSLAFVSNRSGQAQVYVMPARPGADAQQLTDMALGAESPAWSPDGYWLAVVGYTGDGAGVNAREIFLLRADGSDVVRLTTNSHDDMHPIWTRY